MPRDLVPYTKRTALAGLPGGDTNAAKAGRVRSTGDAQLVGRSRKKIDWNSVGNSLNDIIPYASNLANAFKKPPMAGPPNTVAPVVAPRVNYDNQRAEASRQVRGADVAAYRTLDENTAGAVRAANLTSRIRGMNAINEAESTANVGLRAQANNLNAAIDSQNVGILNSRQLDSVEARIAQQRESSQNLSNAADKFMLQRANKDIAKLDVDKYKVLSKMWANSGVDSRTIDWLKKQGYNTPFAAGGELPKPAPDPSAANSREQYYKASAKLLHYKSKLNEQLKAKNPKAYDEFFTGLKDTRMKKPGDVSNYVQNTPYNEYLSAAEVKSTLGDSDYESYLGSLKAVNEYNVQQGQQPLYGQVEGEKDVSNLNYGRRFASLQVTPRYAASGGNKKYARQYNYNPSTGEVDFTEEGDQSLRPAFFSSAPMASKAYGGSIGRSRVRLFGKK